MSNITSAIVIGATGQTGSALLTELTNAPELIFERILAFGNSRKPNISGPFADRVTTAQASMEELAGPRAGELSGFDVIFLHIGTQRRKAGLEGQIQLELHDTLTVARTALQGGCKHCHIVSSAGADANSSFPYLRTKGQVEQGLQQLGFERLVIYRPAMLLGGDRSSGFFHKLCGPILSACVGSISVQEVGRAVKAVALRPPKGKVEVLENAEMVAIARAAAAAQRK